MVQPCIVRRELLLHRLVLRVRERVQACEILYIVLFS